MAWHTAASTPPAEDTTAHDRAAELERARAMMLSQAAAAERAARRLDDAFLAAVDLLCRCSRTGGTVLVSGLGKSGLIGQKISATLASLGLASHFVHPAEAAHGDLGRFRKDDVCLALSYSGETDEVVALAQVLRADGIPVIALTRGPAQAEAAPGAEAGSRRGSSLERVAAVVLAVGDLPDEASWSPAPTLSTTASLVLGDALAVAAARRLGQRDEDFARRHPGGTLGGQLRPVMDVVRFTVGRNLAPVPDDVTVAEALRLAESAGRRPGALLLVDRASGRLSGILTDADVRRMLLRGTPLSRPVHEHMTAQPVSLPAASVLRDAVKLVREMRCDEIPVVDPEGRPLGLLDVQDLIALRLVQD